MGYPKTNGAKIGLDKKLQSYADSQIGQQIGACVNKAVDLAINCAKYEGADKKEIEKDIKEWVDILYEIGTEKKSQILKDQEPKPLTNEQVENAQNRGKKILEVENQEEKAGLEETRTDNIPF